MHDQLMTSAIHMLRSPLDLWVILLQVDHQLPLSLLQVVVLHFREDTQLSELLHLLRRVGHSLGDHLLRLRAATYVTPRLTELEASCRAHSAQVD